MNTRNDKVFLKFMVLVFANVLIFGHSAHAKDYANSNHIEQLKFKCEWKDSNDKEELISFILKRDDKTNAFLSQKAKQVDSSLVEKLYQRISEAEVTKGWMKSFEDIGLSKNETENLRKDIIGKGFRFCRLPLGEKEVLTESFGEGIEWLLWETLAGHYRKKFNKRMYHYTVEFSLNNDLKTEMEGYADLPVFNEWAMIKDGKRIEGFTTDYRISLAVYEILKALGPEYYVEQLDPVLLRSVLNGPVKKEAIRETRRHLKFYRVMRQNEALRPYFNEFELDFFEFPLGTAKGGDIYIENLYFRDKENRNFRTWLAIKTTDYREISNIPDIEWVQVIVDKMLKKQFVQIFLERPESKMLAFLTDKHPKQKITCRFEDRPEHTEIWSYYMTNKDEFLTWALRYRSQPDWLDIGQIKPQFDEREGLYLITFPKGNIGVIENSGKIRAIEYP